MMRLVDADELREFLIKAGDLLKCQDDKRSASHAIGKVIEHLDKMPTVDAVPVVKCKDCKYKYYASNRVPNERCWVCDKSGEDIESMEWFCPYGEKEVDK